MNRSPFFVVYNRQGRQNKKYIISFSNEKTVFWNKNHILWGQETLKMLVKKDKLVMPVDGGDWKATVHGVAEADVT